MRGLLSIYFLVGAICAFVKASSFADLAAELPSCGLQCIEQAIPQSPCDLSNSTCLCTDQTFAGLTQACVAVNCTVKEALTLERVESLACGVPVKSQQVRFKIHAIIACVLGEICVILRIYSNVTIIGRLRLDDYFILIAGIATVPYLYLHCTLSDLGFGLNIWDIQPFDHLYHLLKLFWIDQMMYSLHLYASKLSILCFLSNIFTTRSFRTTVTVIATFSGISFVVTIITTALQCLPVSYNWTSWDGEHVGHCNDLNSQTYAFGAINMFCDIVIIILPLPELYKLQVSGRKKIQLLVVFCLGIIVTTFSVIRLPFLVSLGKTTNPTWDYVEVTIWSIWETELGMMCASLPAIRHLLRTIWPDILRTTKLSSAKATQDSGYDKNSSWAGSRRDRSNANKEYYELDERSLIGNGQQTTPNASTTVIEA